MRRALVRFGVSFAFFYLLSGCSSPLIEVGGNPVPPKISASMIAASDINPDASGRPSPLVLAFYELRSAGKFAASDFLSLYEKPDETLAEDLISRDEFVLSPGEKRVVTLEFQRDSRFLGVVAGFRRFGEANWRAVVETPADRVTAVLISAEGLHLTVSTAQR